MYTNALFHKISMYIAESPPILFCLGFVGISINLATTSIGKHTFENYGIKYDLF
jgi:hypothetical protein